MKIKTSLKAIIFFIGTASQLTAFAQYSDSIVRQFDRYSSTHLQEKVFVHTDKSFYLAGEVIWFKLYVTDAVLHRPSPISKVGYVEVINKSSKAVLQAKIELNAGIGSGSFSLPSGLASGNYIIKAYTNWMKNSDPEYFFEKNISIVNTLKTAGSLVNDSSVYQVQFFPEGGQMVSGLPATVAFHLTDQYGSGVDGRGYLLNRNGDTVLQFSPLHSGIGRFTFTPKKNDQYKAVVKLTNGKTLSAQLPAAYIEGYVMRLSEPDTSHVKVIITANIPAVNSVYLFIHTRGRYKAIVQQAIAKGEAVFVVDRKLLDDGINHFTVFNSNRQPVCERLYFKQPAKKLSITISVPQTSYLTRTKVDMGIFTQQQSTVVADADLSVSAFYLDTLQGMGEPGILPYLLLTSDLNQPVESPNWYFSNNNAETNDAIDNLMLTYGWRRFKWEEILNDKKPYFTYLPELEGPLVTGKIFDKASGMPAGNINTYLSAPGENFQFSPTTSRANGELVFDIGKFYGGNEFIAQTNNREDSNYRLDIVNPFTDKFSNHSFPSLILQRDWKEQIRIRSLNVQLDNAYIREAKQQFNFSTGADTSHFYGKPDKTYYLDDYTRFTTMEEVMHEYVAEVRVRKNSDLYNFKVRTPDYLSFFNSDPLVLLDGVPVFNVNKIMETDPLKIKRLDIITHTYYSGNYIVNGIISYSSYDGSMGGYQLDPNGLVVEYEGLQREREFYSPQYSTTEKQKSRIPDFRNVLYWSPSVRTDEKGHQNISFYTSDLPGKYAVMVQGITPDGVAGSNIITFSTGIQ